MEFDLKEHIENIENQLDGTWVTVYQNSFLRFTKPFHTGIISGLLKSNTASFTEYDDYQFLVEFDQDKELTTVVVKNIDSSIHYHYFVNVKQGHVTSLTGEKNEKDEEKYYRAKPQ